MIKFNNIKQKCDCPACNLFFGFCRGVKKIYNNTNNVIYPKSKYIKK